MKRILYWLGFIDLVWTIDFDGDRRLRIVRTDGIRRIVFGILEKTTGVLLDDGSIVREDGRMCYMRYWQMYSDKPPSRRRRIAWKKTAYTRIRKNA